MSGGESVCWSLESPAPPAPPSSARALSSWLPPSTCRVSPLCTAWLPDWLPRCLAKRCGVPQWREGGKGMRRRSRWGREQVKMEKGQSRIPNQPKHHGQRVKTKPDLSANESEEGLNKSLFNELLHCHRRHCSVFLAASFGEAELFKRLAVTSMTPSLCD